MLLFTFFAIGVAKADTTIPTNGGKIVLNSDDWTLNDTTYQLNIAKRFANNKPNAKFLLLGSYASNNNSLASTISNAGYTYDIYPNSPPNSPSLAILQNYDGVFMMSAYVSRTAMTQYVQGGGKVYLAVGYGNLAEEYSWNTFINTFGLQIYFRTEYSSINPSVKSIPNPLFANIQTLLFWGYTPVGVTGTNANSSLILSQSGDGLIAEYNAPDTVAPVITIAPYTKKPTNQDVIVTATTNEGTLNAASHTFSENGSFSFNAIDAAGNTSTHTVTINNIDKAAPVISIVPYTTMPTNQDVIVTATTNEGTLNAASHTFSENGSFSFNAIDAAGNTSTQTVTIDNIDKVAPVISIDPYTTMPTNQDVIVTATTNDGTLNAASHTFSENGSFSFTATDAVGNTSTQTVTIDNIDKVAPVITIAPYTTTPTNQDLTVTATTNEGTSNAASHTFSENGSFNFTAIDAAGNTSAQTVTIDNIDKVAPVISIDPYTTTPTNQDVIVTATTNEGTLNSASHTFSENGSFSYTAIDAAGNTSTQTVTIDNIDKVAPVITIAPYTTTPTIQDVIVTATTNDGTLNAASHTFSENGSFSFTATDAVGNTSTQTVTIDNIDKVAPVITIAPYTTTPTNQDVIVTATSNEGTLNAASHTFSENGSFTFTATDAAGNTSTQTVTIDNIDKVAPVITIAPYTTTPTNQDLTVTATTNEGTLNAASHTFSENGSFSFTAVDAAGNTSTQTVSIDNIDKIVPITSDDATGLWGNQDVTVNFSSHDLGLGVASTYYTINGGTQQIGSSVTLSAEGIYTLMYWSIDKAGNVEDQRTAAVKIDKTAPAISFTGNLNAYTIDQNINISCSVVDVLSGLHSTNCHNIVGPASGFAIGNNSYTFTATDNVGNVSTSTISFTISVNPESLGNLTQQYFTDASVAASLTSKLNAIQASISKGNTNAKSGQVGAFINQIESKIGKSITYEQAQILIQLVKKL
jgi:hypothetical protein